MTQRRRRINRSGSGENNLAFTRRRAKALAARLEFTTSSERLMTFGFGRCGGKCPSLVLFGACAGEADLSNDQTERQREQTQPEHFGQQASSWREFWDDFSIPYLLHSEIERYSVQRAKSLWELINVRLILRMYETRRCIFTRSEYECS